MSNKAVSAVQLRIQAFEQSMAQAVYLKWELGTAHKLLNSYSQGIRKNIFIVGYLIRLNHLH